MDWKLIEWKSWTQKSFWCKLLAQFYVTNPPHHSPSISKLFLKLSRISNLTEGRNKNCFLCFRRKMATCWIPSASIFYISPELKHVFLFFKPLKGRTRRNAEFSCAFLILIDSSGQVVCLRVENREEMLIFRWIFYIEFENIVEWKCNRNRIGLLYSCKYFLIVSLFSHKTEWKTKHKRFQWNLPRFSPPSRIPSQQDWFPKYIK